MTEQMLDTIRSITALMEEESARLTAPGRYLELAETAEAKVRLTARLGEMITRRRREQPDWPAADPDRHEELRAAIARLRDVASENAAILKRQIDLSNEMMAAVAAEARRKSGKRGGTYGACGIVSDIDYSAPIAVSTSL